MSRSLRDATLLSLCAGALALGACGGAETAGEDGRAAAITPVEEQPSCTASGDAPSPLPRVSAEHETLAYWLERAGELPGGLDEPLMRDDEVDAHNAAVTRGGDDLPFARASLARAPAESLVLREVRERLDWIRERLEDGTYVQLGGARIEADVVARFSAPETLPLHVELRVAVERLALRCGPLVAPFYTDPPDVAFDRNACSTIERQEPVQVLARWPAGMLLVRTRYALGWLADEAALSPPATGDQIAQLASAPRSRPGAEAELASSDGSAGIAIGPDVLVPVVEGRALFATREGIHRSAPLAPGLLEPVRRPLTRRAFLTEAFRHLGEPYGWGGREGGLDCSELTMDTLATFGLELPRHSARQADAGSFSIEVPRETAEAERLNLLDAAIARGVVLLHFPGHVMIYLGRDASGTPMAIHAFAEYLVPCAGSGESSGETLMRVNRVSVSDLELGRHTSRRAFIERVERIVVFGRSPGLELAGVATLRSASPVEVPAPDACRDDISARVFHSPARPHAGGHLRFILTSSRELGPLDVTLVDPRGRRVAPDAVHRLGGPPFTAWVELRRAAPGRWTAVFGDGARVAACERVTVARFPHDPDTPPETPAPDPSAPGVRVADPLALGIAPGGTMDAPAALPYRAIWEPRWSWEEDTENFYAAFVEQLFDYEVDDRTWSSLTELLRDRDHNLLYDHLLGNEDALLQLTPDCADLPYFLRAYFAWKLRLPFAFRRCSRGRAGVPPSCGEFVTTEIPHSHATDVDAFRYFIERQLRPGVHSASGRTAPRDDATDLYPVPMTREALRPGTVFADPYGHLLVIARWSPQGIGQHGVMLGADAQPDGTIGRRTFWRGTFLFTPETGDVGAGFKTWRPVVWDRREGLFSEPLNEELTRRSGYVPFSMQQYEGDVDAFYDRMEGLINPRAESAERVQLALVEALEESVRRRVVSVDNGEQWKREHPGQTIPMPEGADIFLTEGPWEDFSTPSRDMRLLIAIDTVMGFEDAVRRRPERYGLREEELDDALRAVVELRDRELGERRFTYTRSDGSEQTLSLTELIARSSALEMSWNPNDCVEIRWGAESGSEERRSCRSRAPAAQLSAMQPMRAWFSGRRRPTR